MNSKSKLTAETLVYGFFSNIEICFLVGDCFRTESCIKVQNIIKIDEETSLEVPNVIGLSELRLELRDITKDDIRKYFSVEKKSNESAKTGKKFTRENFRRGVFAVH